MLFLKMNVLLFLLFSQVLCVPVEILDDEKTGPQPSIIGSIDKVLKNVNKMDEYQCLQKMICEFMGQTEDAVVSAVSNQLGPQAGQLASSSINQFQTNPSQFASQLQGPNSPIVQAVQAELGSNNQQLGPAGQIVQNLGSQFIQQAFQQRPQNQFQTQFGGQQQFLQQQQPFVGQQQFIPVGSQQQFQQFPQQQFIQGQQQFQQFPQQQFQQFPQQQFQQFPQQQQFVNQQQFQQFPGQQIQQFPQQQFVGQQQFGGQKFQQFPQQTQNNGGFLEGIADSIAGNLASGFAGNLISNLVSGNRKWGKSAQSRSDDGREDNGENIESRVDVHVGEEEDVLSDAGLEENLDDDDFKPSQKIDETLSRKKRQSTAHGQAIRLMQNFGLDNMGLYPFVRAAIIGHANRAAPTNCKQLYRQCPDSSDQLLNYLNNNNGGLLQNIIPQATNEASSLFPGLPGLPSLPQVAASTLETFAGSSSSSSSSSSGGNLAGSLIQAESGIIENLVDGLAGMIAGRLKF